MRRVALGIGLSLVLTACAARKAAPTQEAVVNPNDGFAVSELRVGAGPQASNGKTLTLKYQSWIGSDSDKPLHDSRSLRAPFTLVLGEGKCISGFEKGLEGMRPGGRRRLTLPPALAYGKEGVPGSVPPNATLVFDVELLDLK